MSYLGETARTCQAILENGTARLMRTNPIALTPSECARLRAIGAMSESTAARFNFDTLKQRNRALARASEPNLQAAYEQIKARWGIRSLPKGEVKRAAARFGCEHQTLLNKFYKARLAEDLANGLAPRERGRAA